VSYAAAQLRQSVKLAALPLRSKSC
jgi:hypothetical protein